MQKKVENQDKDVLYFMFYNNNVLKILNYIYYNKYFLKKPLSSISRMARDLDVTLCSFSFLCGLMVKENMAKRTMLDFRSASYELTDKGVEIAKRIFEIYNLMGGGEKNG